MIRRFFNRTAKPDLDRLRNEAVAAWIKTFPVEDRLTAFLSDVPAPMREEVRRSAKEIYAATGAYLEEAASTGDIDLDSFYPALSKHLSERFPWMQDSAFYALRAYTGWFSWHEGYLRTGS
jgi:hypothetical protein